MKKIWSENEKYACCFHADLKLSIFKTCTNMSYTKLIKFKLN